MANDLADDQADDDNGESQSEEDDKTARNHSLEPGQMRDARRREAPSAAVVFEAVRREAETELTRPLTALGWSALAAGLSMGFSFIAQGLLHSYTPDASWRPIVASFGYSVGFMIVILGRQQLFTENTLTPVLEVLRTRKASVLTRTGALWAVVLAGNMVGVAIVSGTMAYTAVLDAKIMESLATIAAHEYEVPFGAMFVRAVFAGWLIALMLWLMPFAETARVAVIVIITYVIGLANFAHVVAGSVAALYAVFIGMHTVGEFFTAFFVPTLLGNIVGGVALVAAINYAQVASNDRESRGKS